MEHLDPFTGTQVVIRDVPCDNGAHPLQIELRLETDPFSLRIARLPETVVTGLVRELAEAYGFQVSWDYRPQSTTES